MPKLTTIISVVIVPHASRWTYYQPKFYAVLPRVDGVLTWRAKGPCDSPPRRARHLAEEDGRRVAAELGLEFVPDVRHGSVVK